MDCAFAPSSEKGGKELSFAASVPFCRLTLFSFSSHFCRAGAESGESLVVRYLLSRSLLSDRLGMMRISSFFEKVTVLRVLDAVVFPLRMDLTLLASLFCDRVLGEIDVFDDLEDESVDVSVSRSLGCPW